MSILILHAKIISSYCRTRARQRTLHYQGPKTWNDLPHDMKTLRWITDIEMATSNERTNERTDERSEERKSVIYEQTNEPMNKLILMLKLTTYIFTCILLVINYFGYYIFMFKNNEKAHQRHENYIYIQCSKPVAI